MKSNGLWGSLAAGALLTVLLAGCDNGDKNKVEKSVRFVDTQQVLLMSGLGEQEAVHLKAVGDRLREGMALAQSRYTTMDDEARRQAELSDRQVLDMQWHAEQQAAHKVVSDAVLKMVGLWQKRNGVDAVLPREHALAVSVSVDITAEIAKELKNEKIIFGQLPKINLKDENNHKTNEADIPTVKK